MLKALCKALYLNNSQRSACSTIQIVMITRQSNSKINNRWHRNRSTLTVRHVHQVKILIVENGVDKAIRGMIHVRRGVLQQGENNK